MSSFFAPPSRRPALRGLIGTCITLAATALVSFSAEPTVVPKPLSYVPAGVRVLRDLPYVEQGHERQKLNLFLPEKPGEAALPVIIGIHGGGWSGGTKDQSTPFSLAQVAAGRYAAASIGYRLSQQVPFPAQLEDCKAAVRWLRAHAKEYGLDPDHIGVVGYSAGGHLAALLGASGGVKTFDVGANLEQSSGVQAVLDNFGPVDLAQFITTPGYEAAAKIVAPLIGGPPAEHRAELEAANAITYVTKEAPPFFIVHGDQDKTVPLAQSELLFAALKQARVPVHLHISHGAGHGKGFTGQDAKDIKKMTISFFDKHLKSNAPAAREPEALRTESAVTAPPVR